jgi:hypothetical protein
MTGYPSEHLYEEVAYIAYHFHWPYDQIMAMDHHQRQRWVAQVAAINQRMNEESVAAQRSRGPRP